MVPHTFQLNVAIPSKEMLKELVPVFAAQNGINIDFCLFMSTDNFSKDCILFFTKRL